jgi:hypothetical protein
VSGGIIRCPGVDIGARFDQRLDAVEVAMLDGYMKGSLIPHGRIRICAMRQQQRDEFESVFCNCRHQGCIPNLRSGVDVCAALEKQFGRIEMLPIDRIVERRCEHIEVVDICPRIQRRRDGSNVALLGGVVNGCRLGCQGDRTEAYQQEHSNAHQLPPRARALVGCADRPAR